MFKEVQYVSEAFLEALEDTNLHEYLCEFKCNLSAGNFGHLECIVPVVHAQNGPDST